VPPGAEGVGPTIRQGLPFFVPMAVVLFEYALIRLAGRGGVGPERLVAIAELTAFAATATLFTATMNEHSYAFNQWGLRGAAVGVIVYFVLIPLTFRFGRAVVAIQVPSPAVADALSIKIRAYTRRILATCAGGALIFLAGCMLLVAVYLA
jgi:hypothetical protein